MENLAVIGLGSLGKRHLQSLLDLRDEYQIYGVEIREDVLELLKGDFPEAILVETIEKLPKKISFCVIATTSNVRFDVFEALVNHSNVQYLLFEKVLFQKIDEYYKAKNLLEKKGIKAWVNCNRRELESYNQICDELKNETTLTYTVTGGEWGLCCNGIHMIDLIEYITGSEDFSLNKSVFKEGIFESKRKGFKEIFGTIAGTCGKCTFFQISCMKGNDTPSLVILNSDNRNVVIDEEKREAYISRREEEWKWKRIDFPIKYQSQMTGELAKKILNTGECNLPSYQYSMRAHLKYIQMWLDEFHRQEWEGDICPIT